jgi:biotin transport system substrate-specific component
MQATPAQPATTLFHAVTSRTGIESPSGAACAASAVFMAALTAAVAQFSVHLPFTQVPVTLQHIVVLLGGLVLGARLGVYSQCLYLAAGIAGLPVFAASATLPPGPLRLLGPTGGFLMVYPLAAYVVGSFAELGWGRRWATGVAAMLSGLVVVYAGGAFWLAYGPASASLGIGTAITTGVLPFVAADVAKIALAAAVAPGLWRLLVAPER